MPFDTIKHAAIPLLGAILIPLCTGTAARAQEPYGFSVANPPSVFVAGEAKPELRLLITHPGTSTLAKRKLGYIVTDAYGKELETGSVPLAETVIDETSMAIIKPRVSTAGWYRVSLSLAEGAGNRPLKNRALPFKDASFATFAVVSEPAETAKGSYFGVCEHTMSPEMAETMRAAGIRWVRTDASWSGVQPDPASWDWERLDSFIDTCMDHGIGVLPIIDYGTHWTNGLEDGERKLPTQAHWEAFVKNLVSRYKDRVNAWEVWNEANIPNFWLGTREEYARLLDWTYKAVKAEQPDSTVMFAGTSGADYMWIRELFTNGGHLATDASAMHPYMQPNPPERSLEQGILAERGVEREFLPEPKPLWITEMGYHTMGEASAVNEATQARYVPRAMVTAASAGVERFFWYEFGDPRINPGDNESNFGLVYSDLSPKPAYVSYAVLERVIGGRVGSRVTRLPYPDKRINVHAAVSDGKPRALIAWTLKGPGTIAIRGDRARVVDMFGGYSVLKRAEGSDTIPVSIGEDPVYILDAPADDLVVPQGPEAGSTSAIGANTVPNGGFESGSGKYPSGWNWSVNGKPKVTFDFVKGARAGDAREGSGYVRMTYGSPRQGHVYGLLSRDIKVKPFTRYRLSAWVRTKGVKCAWIGGGPGWGVRCYLPWDTNGEWQRVEYTFDTWDESSWKLIVLIEEFGELCDVDSVEVTELP